MLGPSFGMNLYYISATFKTPMVAFRKPNQAQDDHGGLPNGHAIHHEQEP